MTIIKSIALAAMAFRIAGIASAAQSNYHYPAMVKHIVTGSVFNVQYTEDQRNGSALYLVGFSSAFNRQCNVVDRSLSARFEKEVGAFIRSGGDDLANGRDVNQHSVMVSKGYQDGEKLAADTGCAGPDGTGATQTIRVIFQKVAAAAS